MARCRMLDHTADLGIEVSADSVEELFAHTAVYIISLMVDLETINVTKTKVISANGVDRDDVWVNFFRELLYQINAGLFLFSECNIIQMDEHHVAAEIKGESFQPERHAMKTEIKAVTYHQAGVTNDEGVWRGTVIFDV